MKCALKFCSNVLSLLDHPSSALSGHRIPKNEPRRSRWIRAIMAGLQTCGHEFDRRMLSNSSARICSAHFLPEQYTGRDGGPRLLERDAVPCVFKLEAPLPFDTGARTTAVIRKVILYWTRGCHRGVDFARFIFTTVPIVTVEQVVYVGSAVSFRGSTVIALTRVEKCGCDLRCLVFYKKWKLRKSK